MLYNIYCNNVLVNTVDSETREEGIEKTKEKAVWDAELEVEIE